MMNFFIDVALKPDAQMPVNRLLNASYTQLHKVLFDLGSNNIGVSFPAHHVLLGNCLRIHGTQQALEQLQAQNWLVRLADHCKVSPISEVPVNIQGYRTVSRIQTTMSQSKLKRLFKRGSITEEEAKGYKAKLFTKGLDNAYVELESASNGHKHRRYIAFGALQPTPSEGVFDTFGLSKTTTVPWFDPQF
jgi:CRISPR-associated endonuclease Csy4